MFTACYLCSTSINLKSVAFTCPEPRPGPSTSDPHKRLLTPFRNSSCADASSLAKPRRAEIVWQLFLNDSSSFSFNQYVDSLRLQSCLLCLINCEWDNVRNPLFFLARSHVVYWFCFVFPASFLVSTPCLLTCEFTAVLPSCTALIIPAFSINIIQITAMVQTSHQSTHIQWRPQPQTNKVRFNTGNINLHFNIFKLKTIYWQTISHNKICSYL